MGRFVFDKVWGYIDMLTIPCIDKGIGCKNCPQTWCPDWDNSNKPRKRELNPDIAEFFYKTNERLKK